jgi:hypothetical protein
LLDELDPTLLLNGLYEIQLTARDVSGRTAAITTTIVVEGQQKVGLFTLSFVDLEVPVAGLPIQVIRTYDSRDKGRHDFGIGWTLDLRTVRLQENNIMGLDWQGTVSGGFFPNYCIVQARPHLVTITLPDGTVYKFQPTLSPNCQQLAPPSQVTVNFVPLPGTNASLVSMADNTVEVNGSFPGDVELVDIDNLILVVYWSSISRLACRPSVI